ncbi:hypothetical protein BZARG_1287 [Bizionia argentinensis JUB59]|uniref:Uncharacterized protein n=1 Tax=Bizionia argentinensis JUB59 TaxID=1046627 RepID=G2EDD8_9FLAO|nr:hypothetical protein [Bizionia argentinensis]EGV43526.1 hypothetical protein BZARG_1287 [Bizionia argentinensis JUB59]
MKKVIENAKLEQEIAQFLKTENFENLGVYYFNNAMICLENKQFNESYDYLILGYNYITCDCDSKHWYKNNKVDQVFKNSMNFDCPAYKIEFLKAFIHLYNGQGTQALISINCFIDLQPNNEIGYYLKGKILNQLNKNFEAIDFFFKALKIKRTSKTLYRIGRTREKKLKMFGLIDLYRAILLNPSSGHAHWHFAEHAMYRGVFPMKFKFFFQSTLSESILIRAFNLGLRIDEIYINEEPKKMLKDYIDILDKTLKQFKELSKPEYETKLFHPNFYGHGYDDFCQGYDDYLTDEFGSDASTAHWNMD